MKGAPQAPKPIDPTKVAGAQENTNVNTALIQQLMNMMGSSNPFGSMSYKQTGTQTVDGHQIPTYSQNFDLSPWAKQYMDPMGDPSLLQQKVTDAIYGQATSRLDPQWQTRDRQLGDQLENKGIPLGSDAYDRAMRDQTFARNDAYTSAQNAATAGGEQAANQLFGEQLSARQEPISNVAQILAMMRGSGPQTGVSPTDVTGAYRDYENQLNQQYQAQMQRYNSMWGGIGNLFGDAMMAAPFLF